MYRTLALLSASLLLLASSANADHIEALFGDAGQTVLTAQPTTGASSMNYIIGSLGVAGDLVDLFQITITDPVNFTAEVIGASFDSQLFLFNTAGNGIASNDDGGTGNLSKLDATNDPNAALARLAVGEYLLGISVYDVDAYVGGSEMFPDACLTSDKTCAPQFAGAFTQWLGRPSAFGSIPAAYMIAVNGVNRAPTPSPEPSAALLFGVGFAASGLAVRQRQRRGLA